MTGYTTAPDRASGSDPNEFEDVDLDPMYAALRRTTGFVWNNLVSIVGVSLVWFLLALPVVTVGPATVGAYRALLSLREGPSGRIDRAAVLSAIRTQFVHATLIGFAPIALLGVGGLYAVAYLGGAGALAGGIAVVAINGAILAWLVSIPTLLGLAEGRSSGAALVDGYVWTANHPVGAAALGVVTVALFVAASLLTVAVALLFAGVTFALHVEFIDGVSKTDRAVAGRAER